MYGVEPNEALHIAIRSSIKKSGLEDVYEVVPCGVDDQTELERHGIQQGSFDTVLCIQVLCCVPRPEDTARKLYRLLKPGGQLIVYEHMRSKDIVSKTIQSMSLS